MFMFPSVLFNIGHGADMAETGSGFSASRHNKAGANRNFRGGSWQPFCVWRVAVAERLWRKSRTAGEERKEKKEGEERSCAVACWLHEEREDSKKTKNLNLINLIGLKLGLGPLPPSKFLHSPI